MLQHESIGQLRYPSRPVFLVKRAYDSGPSDKVQAFTRVSVANLLGCQDWRVTIHDAAHELASYPQGMWRLALLEKFVGDKRADSECLRVVCRGIRVFEHAGNQ